MADAEITNTPEINTPKTEAFLKRSELFDELKETLVMLEKSVNTKENNDDNDKNDEDNIDIDTTKERSETKGVVEKAKRILDTLKKQVQEKAKQKESGKSESEINEIIGDVDAQLSKLSGSFYEKITSFEELINTLGEIEDEVGLAIEFAFERDKEKVEEIAKKEFSDSVKKATALVKENEHKSFEEFSAAEQLTIQLAANELIEKSGAIRNDIIFNLSNKTKLDEIFSKFDKNEKEVIKIYLTKKYEDIVTNDESKQNDLTEVYLRKINGNFTFITKTQADQEKESKENAEVGGIDQGKVPEGIDSTAWQKVLDGQTSYNTKINTALNGENSMLGKLLQWFFGIIGLNFSEVVKTDTTIGAIGRAIGGIPATTQDEDINPMDNPEIADQEVLKNLSETASELENGTHNIEDRAGDAKDDTEAMSIMTPILRAYPGVKVTGFQSSGKKTLNKTLKIKPDNKSTFTKIYSFLSPNIQDDEAISALSKEVSGKMQGAGEMMSSATSLIQEYGEKGGVMELISPPMNHSISGFSEFDSIKQQFISESESNTLPLGKRLSLSLTASGEIEVTWSSKAKKSAATSPPSPPTAPPQPTFTAPAPAAPLPPNP